MPVTITADDMFDPAGLAVALANGCRIAVGDAPGLPPDTYLTIDDLTCASCGSSIDPPRRNVAKWVAYNAYWNDGVCADCDPPTPS